MTDRGAPGRNRAACTDRPRLLLLLAQSPFDPTSGAAQAMRQSAELLAARGWHVQSLCTSACEGELAVDHLASLAAAGLPSRDLGASAEIVHHGVTHRIVRVAQDRRRHWEDDVGRTYDALLTELLQQSPPHVCFTFGGNPRDAARRRRLRARGVSIAFAIHNLAYLVHRPSDCDAFLAPSEWLAGRYRSTWAVPVSVLPTPLVSDGVVATSHDPVFVTFVNPEPSKGLTIVARLAARLGIERPDIPLLVVEGRARAGHLLAAGRDAGVDLTRFDNLMFSPATQRVADIWSSCRILLAPSTVEEAAGRVVVEAMANGAVPLVSDRGALPETAAGVGKVIPLPAALGWRSVGPVEPSVANPWFDAIVELVDDESGYRDQSRAARSIALAHLPEAVGPRYDHWFRSLLQSGGLTVGTGI